MKKIFLAIIACAGLTFSSCSLDEYNPKEITGDEILATYDGIYGLQAQCYAPIYGQLYTVFDFLSMAEGGTDIWWTAKNSDSTREMMYYESLVPFVNKGWDKAFTQMYSALGLCSSVINRADAVSENADAVATLKAEAHFLRGFYHLLLTTYYGPITLVTSEPSESPNLKPERNTLSEIYETIIADFNVAIAGLDETPFEDNRQRATKAAARGMLARAYIQGAGQGLTEGGVSYYQRAKEVTESMIADYGTSKMYTDISDTWADANNRNNKEALFKAAGVDAGEDSNTYWYGQPGNNKLFTYCYPKLSDIAVFGNVGWNIEKNYVYGRTNNSLLAPSKYLIDCFDASWDKRWENSFQCAFSGYSFPYWSYPTYATAQITLTESICTLYGIDQQHVGKVIYPYYNIGTSAVNSYAQGGNQYPAYVWPLGETSGDVGVLQQPKKAYVIDPTMMTADENRFFLYLSKENMSAAEKAKRVYSVVNIEDLFTSDKTRYVANVEEFAAAPSTETPLWKVFPSLNKFQWSYDKVFYGSNLQIKNGDIMIMRMAEIYLIAAEANVALGDGTKAAEHLNVLRKRAARTGVAESAWKLSTADKDTVLDEYAREMCGEFQRWAVLQRNGALKDRLTKYNQRAASAFKDYCVWRPISQTLLQQIDNAEEYGDNGYGTTAQSGLDGYLR